MAGQYVGPRMTRAAIASPVGGQTGEMDGPMVAYRSPKTATAKYAVVRAPARASHHNPVRTVTGCGKQIAASCPLLEQRRNLHASKLRSETRN